MIRFLFLLFAWVTCNQVVAQAVEMADTMRSNGKIYVVVAVLALMLVALFIYLFRIERKLKRLEEEKK